MADQPWSQASIVLVRHGDTEWSIAGRHTSFTDVAMTRSGREQAWALGSRLVSKGLVSEGLVSDEGASLHFSLVLTSPRARAIETCMLAGFGEHAEIDEDLAEWDYGEYEGLTTAVIRERVPMWTIFTHGAPGGETAERVGARADRVIARAAAAGGPVLLFSHAHFLRVLGARWLGLPPIGGRVLGLDTATISSLGYERQQRVLCSWNC